MVNTLDNLITLEELCNQLSISIATGKNWTKLGKLLPTSDNNGVLLFSQDYINEFKTHIENGKNDLLKNRRNKKYISGNSFYSSYVSVNSKNLKSIENILNEIENLKVEITDEIIATIIVYFAKQWTGGKFKFLIDDITENFGYSQKFIEKLKDICNYQIEYEQNEDILGLLYLSLRNLRDRKSTGAYYTPTKIVKTLCANLFSQFNYKNKSVLDPCCGTGNFILQLPEDFSPEFVYASDIDLMSIFIARINYALKFNIQNKNLLYSNIFCCDYLSKNSDKKYDFIIGNPPWGFAFSSEQKKMLQNKYTCAVGSNIESYDVVVEQAIQDLNNEGILSFILPEAFLNVKTHTPIRKYLTEGNSICYLEYFGEVFDGVQCPSVNIQILHNKKPFTSVGMHVKTSKDEFVIRENREINPNCFNFSTNDEEYLLIKKISSIPNKITLKNNADFALGIVTGNNAKFLSTEKSLDNELILKGADILKYKFKNSGHYIKFEPKSFQQVAPCEMYRAKEKLFYKFISDKLVFSYDNQQTLSLNSCNILIPKIDGLTVKYVMAVLNSSIAQFFFKKQFNSIKVLRSHLEQIPIPKICKTKQTEIEKLVEQIIIAEGEDYKKLVKVIDEKISRLYKLSNSEYSFILDKLN